MVRWKNMQNNSLILHTDGSCTTSRKLAGARGIVRRRNGDMIIAFAIPLQFSTNNYGKTQATLFGIGWYCDQNLSNFSLCLNSLLVVNLIQRKIKPPWQLESSREHIIDRVRERNIKVSHCYREVNMVADVFAKHATTINQNIIFTQEGDLPREARRALRMDKLGLPTFRIRQVKYEGWNFAPP
ncbi:uncharacterized protein LOC142176783 [Nicotiana tabacum]|uniref:Uncharacterized protein LOC142176783 n=1 Tax=Nicotiana tabacum TaxID=4097 RepID=A0AC58TVH9_TOBAC